MTARLMGPPPGVRVTVNRETGEAVPEHGHGSGKARWAFDLAHELWYLRPHLTVSGLLWRKHWAPSGKPFWHLLTAAEWRRMPPGVRAAVRETFGIDQHNALTAAHPGRMKVADRFERMQDPDQVVLL